MATTVQEEHALTTGKAFPWHEIYAPNAQAAIDFYTQCLGMGTEDHDMGPMGKYRMLTRDGKGVAGVLETSQPHLKDVPPHWAVYMSVDDVDACISKCKDKGATVVVEPMNIEKVGRMSLIRDPQGAHIWLFKASSM